MIVFERRASDSPLVESVTRGHTLSAGDTIRPAEINWHLVFVRVQGEMRPLVVGPWTTAGPVAWGADAEILWVRFKLGTFITHMPTSTLRDQETRLPGAASASFWLHGSAWQFPTYDNVDTFVERLARDGVLISDPLVSAVLRGEPHAMSPRTVRHRFQQATGLSHGHILQVRRAQQAAVLLQQGTSILDTIHEAGYYDQPHLTRSLKRFIGTTPAQPLPLLSDSA